MGDDSVQNLDDEIENGDTQWFLEEESPYHHYSSFSSEEDEEEPTAVVQNFNIDLPSSHTYLGKLNNPSSRTLLEDGEILSLIGINTKTLVLPGFTLPLFVYEVGDSYEMSEYLKKINIFVLLCTHFSDPRKNFEYGVLMEVIETGITDDIFFTLKARGLQRCLVISEVQNITETLQSVLVEVLPDYEMSSPLVDTQLYALKAKRPFLCEDFDNMKKIRRYRRFHAAQFTYPGWLYEEYEVCYFVKHILEGLKTYFDMKIVPKDPLKLSYWFIQNYLLQYEERLKLLQESSLPSRLRLEMQYLKSNRRILCSQCRKEIAKQHDIIVLSKEGTQSSFVNPGGQVYEIVTVSSARNISTTEKSFRRFSWFPRYTWAILKCQQCSSHLGWKYASSAHLPSFFYGLAMNCITVKKDRKNPSENSIHSGTSKRHKRTLT